MSALQEGIAFEIPSKTFVIGEYLAINGTASLILASEPFFYVKVIQDKLFGFHPDSPAGNLKKQLKMDGVGFSFFDPHQGRGGFGRSTAEYLSVFLAHWLQENGEEDWNDKILSQLEDVVPQYQKSCGGDYKPSGADLVAQLCGGLCWYDGMNYLAESLSWPFPGYDMFIFHTGKKLATHEHLADLKEKNLRPLIPILLAARTSLDQKNLKVFCESLNYYYDCLNEMSLSDPGIYKTVLDLRENPEVLAAKGCGAMGVDTVLIIAEATDFQKIKDLGQARDFQLIAQLSQRHKGALLRREN
ncbi:MAG: hypothetical protein AAF203_10900 [Pseudomonadota bacterium]